MFFDVICNQYLLLHCKALSSVNVLKTVVAIVPVLSALITVIAILSFLCLMCAFCDVIIQQMQYITI